MKVTRAVTIDVNIFDLINMLTDFAGSAKKEELTPYYWDKIRTAADTMERTFNGEF